MFRVIYIDSKLFTVLQNSFYSEIYPSTLKMFRIIQSCFYSKLYTSIQKLVREFSELFMFRVIHKPL